MVIALKCLKRPFRLQEDVLPGKRLRPLYGPNSLHDNGKSSPKKHRNDEALPHRIASIAPPQGKKDSPFQPKEDKAPTAFVTHASIKHFDLIKLPTSQHRPYYNDDISVAHLQGAARHHAGKQRRGATEDHLGCPSLHEHVGQSLNTQFPLSLSTPLPPSIEKAAIFLRDSPPDLILSFWVSQLSKWALSSKLTPPTEVVWAIQLPHETLPATGKIRLSPLMLLPHQCGIGGSIWFQQFIFGFRWSAASLKALSAVQRLPRPH